ncbi:MAG: DNA polymerase III subunit delta [Pseudomonadota bacterium]
MKLSGRDAARFASAPDLSLAGVLIYGDDGAEVAARRRKIVDAVVGDDPEGDMRVERIGAADARRDPAALADAIRAQGFFAAGRRVLLVEEAGDGVAPALTQALEGATAEDAFVVVTAGVLPARSKLRALFEKSKTVAAAPVYADAMDRDAVRAALEEAGVKAIGEDALRAAEAVAAGVDRAAFRDFAARLALYVLDEDGPVGPEDVAAVAPGAAEADLDEALDAVADGRAEDIGPTLARLAAQGTTPVTLVIAAERYFRRLHKLAAEAERGGLDAAIGRLRPPVFGPRRDALNRRARRWTIPMSEGALKLLLETDGALRGGVEGAGFAVLERAFLKLALSSRRER